MPTDIHFAGESGRVQVDEDPGQVAEAFASAGGLPVRLTTPGGHQDVYVNPSTVAFWLLSDPRHDHEPPSGPPDRAARPPKRQEPLTDVWGQPLRGGLRR